MYRFEKLTKYIPLLDQTEIGNWVIDTENDGTIEHPIQFPFVAYSSLVSNFIDDVSGFVEDNPELHLNRYPDILEESGLEWSTQSMSGAIAEDLDAKVVCALIVGAVRAERFCDGAANSVPAATPARTFSHGVTGFQPHRHGAEPQWSEGLLHPSNRSIRLYPSGR